MEKNGLKMAKYGVKVSKCQSVIFGFHKIGGGEKRGSNKILYYYINYIY
jgi:hypothetical protein